MNKPSYFDDNFERNYNLGRDISTGLLFASGICGFVRLIFDTNILLGYQGALVILAMYIIMTLLMDKVEIMKNAN